MARGAILHAGITRRIRASAHTLDVYYQPVRQVPVSPPMSGPPANLLSGTRVPDTLFPPTVETTRPPVLGVQCLWQDLQRITNQRDRIAYEDVGWVEGAHAYVRVLAEDVLLDPTAPYTDTVFEGLAYVVHDNKRYVRLQTDPVSASFADPFSYQLWLRGAWKD